MHRLVEPGCYPSLRVHLERRTGAHSALISLPTESTARPDHPGWRNPSANGRPEGTRRRYRLGHAPSLAIADGHGPCQVPCAMLSATWRADTTGVRFATTLSRAGAATCPRRVARAP